MVFNLFLIKLPKQVETVQLRVFLRSTGKYSMLKVNGVPWNMIVLY